MKEIDKVSSLKKLFQRLAFIYFGLIWIDLIIMFIPDYNSFGQTFYNNYGINGLTFYMSTFIIISGFFLWVSKQLNMIEIEIRKERIKNKETI